MTLFRDQRQEEYDNKDWFFILEDVKVIYYRFLIYTNFYYGSHCVKTFKVSSFETYRENSCENYHDLGNFKAKVPVLVENVAFF